MFGSKDKPEHPQQDPERSDDGKSGRKGLFGWMRRKGDDAPGEAPAQPPAPAEAVTEEAPADKPAATGSHDQSARQAAAELFSGLAQTPAEPAEQPAAEPKGFFARMRAGLSKTSANLGEGMANLFLGEKEIDDELLEEMETRLLMADVGIEATTLIMESLQQRVRRRELSNRNALYRALQNELERLLTDVAKPLQVDAGKKPYVILVVGVNGVGKTTTIGKLAKRLQGEGKQVMLAAGDTFRAAAVEQLQVWGERNNIPVIAQHTGADSASVVFDALQAAQARGADVLIADTAGRLHNKDNLMDELRKVKRVMAKLDPDAPHEVLLVLDAGTGQNAISQTRLFDQAVDLTGLVLTKLDGTAKGGVIFALAKQFGLPIRYIGVGEQIDDLRPFTAPEFVKALFGRE
ncbi:MAG: signal recognition particle-docking protein FtsY [Pseudomonas formosensis]|nr:signal recognition particle-docking protein FtsY [Halopseudomonas formosensis]